MMNVTNLPKTNYLNKEANIKQNKTNFGTKKNQHSEKTVKVASIIGSSVGIASVIGGLLLNMKRKGQVPKYSDLRYGEKEVLALGAASITGGLVGGSIADKKSNNKAKLREGIRQFAGNILAPVTLVAITTRLLEKSKFTLPKIKGTSGSAKFANQVLGGLPQVVATLFSLVTGMSIGNKIINKVNNKLFHENKEVKKMKPSDYSAHIDDVCYSATFMFKNPGIQKVVSKILPASFIIAGTETGITKADDKN